MQMLYYIFLRVREPKVLHKFCKYISKIVFQSITFQIKWKWSFPKQNMYHFRVDYTTPQVKIQIYFKHPMPTLTKYNLEVLGIIGLNFLLVSHSCQSSRGCQFSFLTLFTSVSLAPVVQFIQFQLTDLDSLCR